jgi:hypothetical protein
VAIAGIPQNLSVSQGNRQVLVQWDVMPGATSYSVQRSLDGQTWTTVGSPASNSYTDSAVTVGTLYYYQVASVNSSGTSSYAGGLAYGVVPTPNGEMSLVELRLRAQQAADRVNSNFVTKTEWNFNLNQSLTELYDLLITTYDGDYFCAEPATFTTDGTTSRYPLPNGLQTFKNDSNQTVVAVPFYKLLGVDLNVSNANNAQVTMGKFGFVDRNKFLYPNSSGTIYGVFNMRYRLMANNIMFTPTPSAGQNIRLWYIPKMPVLLADTDITVTGISGWLEYVIVDAAIKALMKEESDVSALQARKEALRKRIEESAPNRDAGQPDTISDTRGAVGGGWGWNGPMGGF